MDHENNIDDIDRRGFLKCMAWAGSGLLFTVAGGIPRSFNLSHLAGSPEAMADAARVVATSSFSFVQISDSHIGFSKDANKDVLGTLQSAVAKINQANAKPDLLIHTGDLSHLSKDDEFDALDQLLKDVRVGERFFVPGEHDMLVDNGKNYFSRYGKGAQSGGWYSFDHQGVHFVALVNVLNLKPGGLGELGNEQIDWLRKDVDNLPSSTPIVIFAHVPLWSVYPEWGWGTDDGARALELVKRFGSVTVLNGHIHQSVQKIEGNMVFHTACSTAFPQPKPGQAKGPGPMTVPAENLRRLLGLTTVQYVEHDSHLAIVDSTLDEAKGHTVQIENFSFSPSALSVAVGTAVTWTNKDDMIHTVVENDGLFRSKALDTGDSFTFQFTKRGTFPYYCSVHPKMTAKVVVA
jgi:3',5'-cyclic AMP phosphodiesterase CpdA